MHRLRNFTEFRVIIVKDS